MGLKSSLGVFGLLLEDASRMHGHTGPFLALGIRVGLRAIELLGYNPFKMRIKVISKKARPYTCFIDGLQYVTSCTLGKGNIELEEGEGLAAVVKVEEREVFIKVKDDILNYAIKSNGEENEEKARKILLMREEDLFEVKI